MDGRKFAPVLADDLHVFFPRPVSGVAPDRKNWTFSFRYWAQNDFFGLGEVKKSWFLSLLERLKSLSNETVEEFLSDYGKQDSVRFHEIDWNANKCPISRSDLKWLPKEILNNEKDFPIFQFHVSKSLGRIVGFFDEKNVFNIILFDPLHNLQPCKKYDYKVTKTSVLSCEYSSFLHKVDSFINSVCRASNCVNVEKVERIRTGRDELLDFHVVMLKINEDDYDCYLDLRKNGRVSSLDEVFFRGLESEIEKL